MDQDQSILFSHLYFDFSFSVLSEKLMSSLQMLISSCPGTQSTRRCLRSVPGVLGVKAEAGLLPRLTPPSEGTQHTCEVLGIPDSTPLHSQKCGSYCLSFLIFNVFFLF